MLFYLLDQAADPLELLMETSYTIRCKLLQWLSIATLLVSFCLDLEI